jgi:membrane protease YdiL (CAAX protease family)
MHRALRGLFVGVKGVRSGWRVLLYCAVLAALVSSFVLVIRAVRARLAMPGQPAAVLTPGRAALNEGALLLGVLLTSAMFGRFEKRSLADYGLPVGATAAARFLEGLVWGVGLMSGVLVVLRLTGNFHFGPIALTPEQIAGFAIVWAAVFAMVGVAESLAFSGYPLFALTRGLGFWPAAALLAALFGSTHFFVNAGENWPGSLSLAIVGLLVAFTLRRTGSLWFAIGMHAAWDWAQSFLYGVPDSGITVAGHLFTPSFQGSPWMTGGSAGPEASIVTLVGYVFAFAFISLRFPERAKVHWIA